MKKGRSIAILCLLFLLWACDTVHEFPHEEPRDPDVLVVDVEVKAIVSDITISENVSVMGTDIYPQQIGDDKELRMVAEFYRVSDNVLCSRVEKCMSTNNMAAEQNFSVNLKLDKYYVLVWREFVEKDDPTKCLYYNTANGLRSVTLSDPNVGNDDAMDCCFGTTNVDLTPYKGQTDVYLEIPVEIKRAVAKYILISNDVALQTQRVIMSRGVTSEGTDARRQAREIIGQYKCRVLYEGNGLYGFDCVTGKPNDAKAGMYFDAELEILNETEARIAFSYPFAFAEGNTIHVTLQIFDENNKLIQEVPDVAISVVQGKLTVIKSDFLTHEYPQGITIDQEYEGEFNINLPD